MQRVCLVEVKYGKPILKELEELLSAEWYIKDATPIMAENDSASYTKYIIYVLQNDYILLEKE
jgi:hypothetical protein